MTRVLKIINFTELQLWKWLYRSRQI